MLKADLENEEWRIVESNSNYAVSNLGRVKRLTGGKRTHPGRLLKTDRKNRKGYIPVGLYHNGTRVIWVVHRLVATMFIGKPPTEKHEAAHWDGNPSNNCVSNLRWALSKENSDDRRRHERTGFAKLSVRDVIVIRKLRKTGLTLLELSNRFGMSLSNIHMICERKTWKHVSIEDEV